VKRFSPSLPLPLPSLEQVLWRSGCPPGKAGEDITESALIAVRAVSSISSQWCGSIFFEVSEVPDTFSGIFPGKPVSVMAVTLGEGFHSLLSDYGDLQGFINDSAASVAVESYMKKLQLHLSDSLGMTPTKRVAPGYGKMPLSVQREIIGMFPDSGIDCTDEYMLSPVKSMTGVVGWIQQEN